MEIKTNVTPGLLIKVRASTNYCYSHLIELDSQDMALRKMEYIHNNPVKELIVLEPHHYYYSSASFYHDEDNGLIEIEPLY